MLFSNTNREDLEKLNELVSLETQVKAIRLQDILGERNSHEDMEKAFEPVTKSIKDVSEDVRKTVIENSINNNKAIENLIENFSRIVE